MGSPGQIMLSYQWDSQKEVIQIKEALEKCGYDVWMDLDDMRGNIYEKMAEGVENSDLIIPCMSSKYEASVNCKKEFNYSQDRRKPMVPLMMESGYRPSGSLGLIIAGMKYVDFSDFGQFDNKMIELQQELTAFFKANAPPVQEMKSLGISGAPKAGDYFMKVKFLHNRANSWNGSADMIIQAIEQKKLKKGQLIGIDAHNNGKDEQAIFAAFYDMNAPSQGDLNVSYEVQNAGCGWNTFYTQAAEQASSVRLEDVVGMTASCNSGGKSVFYVFQQTPSVRDSCPSVSFVEVRGSWDSCGNNIIQKLAEAGCQNGQVMRIDAHNNGEGESGILSAFWSPDLPATGPLSVGFDIFKGGESWVTFYGKCTAVCNKKKRCDFINITGSIDTPDSSVMFVFYYK